MAEKKADTFDGLFTALKEAASKLRNAGELDYMKLSIAAKTDFMLREKQTPATDLELEQSAKRLGWNVTTSQVAEAIEYLCALNLANRAQR